MVLSPHFYDTSAIRMTKIAAAAALINLFQVSAGHTEDLPKLSGQGRICRRFRHAFHTSGQTVFRRGREQPLFDVWQTVGGYRRSGRRRCDESQSHPDIPSARYRLPGWRDGSNYLGLEEQRRIRAISVSTAPTCSTGTRPIIAPGLMMDRMVCKNSISSSRRPQSET